MSLDATQKFAKLLKWPGGNNMAFRGQPKETPRCLAVKKKEAPENLEFTLGKYMTTYGDVTTDARWEHF